MSFKPILQKLLIVWATAFAVLITGVCATPSERETIQFSPLPQLIVPEIAKGQENALFDHDLDTDYPALLPSQVLAELGIEGQTIDKIRIYGNASYLLTVNAHQKGSWTADMGLKNLDLSVLQPEQWHEFTVSTCVTSTHLLFDLTPIVQSDNAGLREIQIWVKKTPGCTDSKKLAGSEANENSAGENSERAEKTVLSSPTEKTEKVVPGQAKKISHEEAELDINAEAVTEEKDLTIATLDDTNLPALDAGMVNVTKGPRKGYRFLPSGKFNKKIKVKIPYDKSLLPADKTEEDINTYYFDKELGRWQALKRVTLDTKGKNVVSETDHFTDFIETFARISIIFYITNT